MSLYQTMNEDKGARGCVDRWNLIKGELPQEGLLLDIGSAEGYFVKQIVDSTNMLAVSVENKKERVQYQS